jgi:hypothetical protein
MKLNNRLRIEALTIINELNQYLNGNVTTDNLRDMYWQCAIFNLQLKNNKKL